MIRKAPFKLGKLKYRHITQITQLFLLLTVFTSAFLFMSAGHNGLQLLINAGVAVIISGLVEFGFAKSWGRFTSLKKLYFKENILIIPLTVVLLLPLHAPAYVVAVSVIIAAWIGKLVYGGYGYGIFNASVVGVLFSHISFKTQLALPEGLTYPITMLKEASLIQNIALISQQPLFVGGAYYTYAAGAISGLVLVIAMIIMGALKVIDIRLSVVYLLTVFGISYIMGGSYYAMEHLLSGMVLFAAVFLVTDPISSPTSRETKIVFAAMVGLLTVMVRVLGSNTEGVLYAILLGNIITPYINRTARKSGYVSLAKAVLFWIVVVVGGGIVLYNANLPEAVELLANMGVMM